jgi:hypothetical protein
VAAVDAAAVINLPVSLCAKERSTAVIDWMAAYI